MWARSSTRSSLAALLFSVGAAGCARSHAAPLPTPLRVAAAADLAMAFKEVGAAFEKESGQKVIFSFGSTGLLEKQIAEGAPFDVFAAANVSFADDAIAAGACAADSKTLYARGRIVLWTAKAPAPPSLAALAEPTWAKIAVANPAHAPYGKAAMQAFEKAGLAAQLKSKLVFGENVQQTLQFAQSGNADVAVVALSLAIVSGGAYTPIDESMHAPIEQAMVVCGKDRARLAEGRAFTQFVSSPGGRAVMRRYGFLLPGEKHAMNTK